MTHPGRVAEDLLGAGPPEERVRVRVDLHGVSVFPPGQAHTVIRWEWMDRVAAEDGVVIHSAGAEITLPPGTFGLTPAALAERLRAAASIHDRVAVIAELGRA